MKLTILNVHPGITYGGIEQTFIDYTSTLIEGGHSVICVVDPSCPYLQQLKALGAQVRGIPIHGNFDFLAAYRLRKLFPKILPDIAIGHSGRSYRLLARLFRGRLPLVAVKHNSNLKHLGGMDLVLCVNGKIREQLVAGGFGADKTELIYNMIDIHGDAPPRRATPGVPAVIGALGRFSFEKGFDTLLQALGILHRTRPDLDWRLRLGGSGALDTSLRALARELGIDQRVEFPGWITDKQAFFSGMGVFVLPSRAESFGIVLLEAMKYGVPVVATRTDGPLEIITDGAQGLLTEPDNPVALAARLQELLLNPALGSRMAESAFHMARQRFSHDVVGKRLEQILVRLAQTARH